MTPSQQKRMIGCGIALLLLIGFGLTVVLVSVALLDGDFGLPDFRPSVAVVEVFGVIGEDDRVLEQLDAIAEDGSVEALVLHINSPGGGAAATQRIVGRLQELQRGGLPVVAALESVAASGGYYVACIADSILTLPATLAGSIGAIMAFPEFSALLTKLGIQYQVVTAGEFKDVGSFHREMTDDERRWVERMLEEVLDQFVATIEEGRPSMSSADIRQVADGRIFTGEMAVDLGLADRLGSLEDAIDVAAELAGMDGSPRVVRKRQARRFWDRLIEEHLGDLSALRQVAPAAWPRLEYRWR